MISIKNPVTGENFINRIDLLKTLHAIYPIDNVALIGPRRIGKSSITEEFLRTLDHDNTVKIRFMVDRNIGTPGKFGVRLLRDFLAAYFRQIRNEEIDIYDIEIDPAIVMDLSNRINSQSLYKIARFLLSYFPASPENERTVLERVLLFIQLFSEEMELSTALVLDEFQEIIELDRFKNFGNGKFMAFLNDIISNQNNVWYLFTGSAVRLMKDILEAPDSPFYGRVKRFDVKSFTKEDTIKLAHKCTNKPITAEALELLYSLANGHPFTSNVIVTKASLIAGTKSLINKKHIEEAFISEISGGTLDSHCNYLLETSLGRSGINALLKEILRTLSRGEATLTELAKKLGRTTGYLSLPLRNLYNLDMIEKQGKKYFIVDNILKIWLNSVSEGDEPDEIRLKKSINENYQEKIASLSTDVGIFFESYLREMLRKFNGQKFEELYLPKFESVEAVNAFDEIGRVFGKSSNIEIDCLCLGQENWICEFKYRNKYITEKDINILIKKKQFIEVELKIQIHKILFITKSAYKESSFRSDVWCMDLKKLDDLLTMLGMKKISKSILV